MAEKPEQCARAEIDRLLVVAGWSMQSMSEANAYAGRKQGTFIRNSNMAA